MNKEQMKELFGQLSQGMEKMMNKITGNVKQVMEEVTSDNLVAENSLDNAKLKKVLKERPVVETMKENGKFKVLLDGETLLDLDLDLSKYKEE